MESVKDVIVKLQNNLKESAKIMASEFNGECHKVADKLFAQIEEIQKYAKDSKDHSVEVIKKQYDSLKISMEEYQKITEDKLEDYREMIVNKLNDLNKKIEEYNNKHIN